jgi:cobalt/nickel transport protein
MNPKNRNLLIGGLIVALIIGVMSPFIASNNPDGLDSSAQHLNPQALNNPGYYHAPFENYKVPFLGNGPLAGVAALVIGVIVVLGIAYLLTELIKRRNNTDN